MVNGFNYFIFMSILIGIKFISFMYECFYFYLKKFGLEYVLKRGMCILKMCVFMIFVFKL